MKKNVSIVIQGIFLIILSLLMLVIMFRDDISKQDILIFYFVSALSLFFVLIDVINKKREAVDEEETEGSRPMRVTKGVGAKKLETYNASKHAKKGDNYVIFTEKGEAVIVDKNMIRNLDDTGEIRLRNKRDIDEISENLSKIQKKHPTKRRIFIDDEEPSKPIDKFSMFED